MLSERARRGLLNTIISSESDLPFSSYGLAKFGLGLEARVRVRVKVG